MDIAAKSIYHLSTTEIRYLLKEIGEEDPATDYDKLTVSLLVYSLNARLKEFEDAKKLDSLLQEIEDLKAELDSKEEECVEFSDEVDGLNKKVEELEKKLEGKES